MKMKRKHLLITTLTACLLTIAWVAHSREESQSTGLKGTIPVQEGSPVSAQRFKARFEIDQVIQATSKIQPGKIIKAELEDESGFLVWEVEVLTSETSRTELLLDAGDGTLLRRRGMRR